MPHISSALLVAVFVFVKFKNENAEICHSGDICDDIFVLVFSLGMLLTGICCRLQASVSAKRLRDFLKNEELDEDSVTRDSAAGMNISYCISCHGSRLARATKQNVSKLTAFLRGWVSLSQYFRGRGRPWGIFFLVSTKLDTGTGVREPV